MDGAESFSEEVSAVFAGADHLELLGAYPHPVWGASTIRFAVPKGITNASVALYDLLGRQLKEWTVRGTGRQTMTLNASQLAPGTYFLRLSGGGQVRTQKMTVVR